MHNLACFRSEQKDKGGAFNSFLPFFGEPAITNTAMSRIAKMSGAAMLRFFAQRLEGDNYRLKIFFGMGEFPTENDDPNEPHDQGEHPQGFQGVFLAPQALRETRERDSECLQEVSDPPCEGTGVFLEPLATGQTKHLLFLLRH